VPSKFTEDSNIIDFIEVKMLNLANEYAARGHLSMAEAIWTALDQYMSGHVDIIFKAGEPYVIKRENADDIDE